MPRYKIPISFKAFPSKAVRDILHDVNQLSYDSNLSIQWVPCMIPPWGFYVRERETINHISIPWLDFLLFLIFLLIKVMTSVDRKTNSLAKSAITKEKM